MYVRTYVLMYYVLRIIIIIIIIIYNFVPFCALYVSKFLLGIT
jgi:hypothetical protein